MLYRSNGLAVLGLVLMHLAMFDQLFSGLWVLSFGETGELFRSNSTGESELVGQPAMPFSLNRVALLPIVLLGCREPLGMVRLCLGSRERFRYGPRDSFTLAISGLGGRRYRER